MSEKPWVFSNVCMDCEREIRPDQMMKAVGRHPKYTFGGKENKYGSLVPAYVKEFKCLCGRKYYAGFYKKQSEGYVIGLLVDKDFNDGVIDEEKRKAEEEASRPVPLKHKATPTENPFDGYKEEELKIPIPPEIEMMDRMRLNKYAVDLGLSTQLLGLDDDQLRKVVAMEDERKRIKRARGQAAYLKGLGAYKARKQAAEQAGEQDQTDDTADDGDTIQIVAGDVKSDSPTEA